MGFIATDLARIPASGYTWYLFLLTDKWNDPVQDSLLNNFDQLISSVGSDCLVVSGSDSTEFYNSLLDTQLGKVLKKTNQPIFPSLVLSNYSPKKLDTTEPRREELVALLISLRLKKDIYEFLRELSKTIRMGDPEELFNKNAESKWLWLTQYLELKPNFLGLGLNLNPLFDKLFTKYA